MTDLTSQPADDIASLLHSYLRRLKDDQEKITAEIRLVESKLADLGKGIGPPTKHRRRPRGTNQSDVEKTLMDSPKKTFTVGQIADIVKIQTSSTRYALTKLSEKGVAKEISKGYWQAIVKSAT